MSVPAQLAHCNLQIGLLVAGCNDRPPAAGACPNFIGDLNVVTEPGVHALSVPERRRRADSRAAV